MAHYGNMLPLAVQFYEKTKFLSMLLSMTGYGKAKDIHQGRSYTIDVKTLNGKMSDLRLKTPAFLRSKEIELRQIIMNKVVRGKIDCTITVIDGAVDADYKLNIGLIEEYINQLAPITQKHNLEHQDILQTIIRIPNIIQTNDEEVSDEEWSVILNILNKAISELNDFRSKEGVSMYHDLTTRVSNIKTLLDSVAGLEAERKEEMVARLKKSIDDHISSDHVDSNRLEQEIVYYLEKLDVHEEKVRLAQHCAYFIETAENTTFEAGKKLGFIAQEMGREINTMGSKAQYSPLQQIVVQMKVELDQIKEQLANVV